MVILMRVVTLVCGVALVGRAVGTPGSNTVSAVVGAGCLVLYVALVELRLHWLIDRERSLDRLVRELQRGSR